MHLDPQSHEQPLSQARTPRRWSRNTWCCSAEEVYVHLGIRIVSEQRNDTERATVPAYYFFPLPDKHSKRATCSAEVYSDVGAPPPGARAAT